MQVSKENVRELREALATYERETRSEPIQCSGDVVGHVSKIRNSSVEKVMLLCLDTKNKVLRSIVLTVGDEQSAILSPRAVFRAALKVRGCTRVIVAHNHPSGDPMPSKEDVEITKKLRAAGETIGIPLLDHVVVAGHNYISMCNMGWIE